MFLSMHKEEQFYHPGDLRLFYQATRNTLNRSETQLGTYTDHYLQGQEVVSRAQRLEVSDLLMSQRRPIFSTTFLVNAGKWPKKFLPPANINLPGAET